MSRRLASLFLAERDRWALWLPVLAGVGVALHFALAIEPPVWSGAAAAIATVLLALALRRRPLALVAVIGLGALVLGAGAAQWRAALVAAPVLERETRTITLAGRVAAAEPLARGQRVVLEQVTLPPGHARPERVRLRLTDGSAPAVPGQWIELRAVLTPPPAPSLPGGYDFARQAWFERLGAVGYAVSRPEAAPVLASGPAEAVAALRRSITERVLAAVPGGAGAVAAALLTGHRGAIPEDLNQAYRDSGLAHLLSISGLHMSMLAALCFLLVRRSLALIPPLALRYPIKKWAAVAALVATFAYLLIAGAPVPTQRAFLMTGVVLLAVLADRTALSMRVVAWAAMAVLLAQPEALIGASFQMSFAAVVALIATYEAMGDRLAAWRARRPGLLGVAAAYLAGVALTTLIAGGATTIYGLYHFNRVATWSLAANMIAVPLTGFWVMPLVVLIFVLMPLGLDGWALTALGWGCEAVNEVARQVASWPAAAVSTPSMPLWGLCLFTLGGLWLCLWRRRWRLFGLPAMALALVSLAFDRPPDVMIDGEAGLLAVRAGDGGLLLSSSRGGGFARDTWEERTSRGVPSQPWPASGASADGRLSCDAAGCLYRAQGRLIALVRHPAALAEDCAAADAVVATVPVRAPCAARLVIDRFSVWREGAHALWIEDDGIRVESVTDHQGARPWTRRRGKPDED